MFWIVQIVVSIALAYLAYLFTAKPKATKPDTSKSLEVPIAEAGVPVPVVFGTKTIKSPNALWTGDVETRIRKVKL